MSQPSENIFVFHVDLAFVKYSNSYMGHFFVRPYLLFAKGQNSLDRQIIICGSLL